MSEPTVVALSPKIQQRQRRTRDLLLGESARLFVERGFENVSVEEILAATGIARSSFYRFFANREDILSEIVRPVFELGRTELDAIRDTSPAIVSDILAVYLKLWRRRPNALRDSARIGGVHFSLFKDVHNRFRTRLQGLLEVAAKSHILLNDNPDYSARLIARVAIPTLEVYSSDPRREQLFMTTMQGLLLKSEMLS